MAEEIKTARSLQNLLVKAQFFLMSGQVSIGFLEALGSQEVGFSKVDFYKRQVVFGWPMRLSFVTSWILWKKQLLSRVQWGAFSIACPSPLHGPFLEMSSLWGTTFAWLYPGADTWTNGFGREEKVLFDREAGNPLCQGSAKMTLRPRTPLISIPLTVSTRQSQSEFSRYTQGRARGECAASKGAL